MSPARGTAFSMQIVKNRLKDYSSVGLALSSRRIESYISILALIIAIASLVISTLPRPEPAPVVVAATPEVSDFDIFIQPGFAAVTLSKVTEYPTVFTKGQWLTIKSLGTFSAEVTVFFVEVPSGMTVSIMNSTLTPAAGGVAQTTFDVAVTGPLAADWTKPGWYRITLVAVSSTGVVHTKSFPIQVK